MRQRRQIWIIGLWHRHGAPCTESSHCITESPCAREKQHRQPWTAQWVDMQRHIIGSFRCCHYFSFSAADDFSPRPHPPGDGSNTGLWVIHLRIRIQFALSHTSPGWMSGCDSQCRWLILSQSYHVTGQAMRRVEKSPAALTHDCDGLATLSQNW